MTEINTHDQAASQEDPDRYTDDHMVHLPGVDHDWARQFIEYDQKFHRFYDATGFFWVTPRIVKIGILKPDAIIGLLRKEHQEWCEEQGKVESFEESFTMDWEDWLKPMKTALPIWDLQRGLKCYLHGMTPMQALQDMHADSEDGHENDPVSGGSGTIMIGPVLVLWAFSMFVVGIFMFYGHVRDLRDHAAKVDVARATTTYTSTSHH